MSDATDHGEYGTFPLRTFLDFDLGSPEAGICIATTLIRDLHLNPNGVLHGGVLFTMVDTAMGRATMDLLEPGYICATIEIHTRFLRPVGEGELSVEVRVVKPGRRVVHLSAEATDSEGSLVATATGSFAVLAPPGDDGAT